MMTSSSAAAGFMFALGAATLYGVNISYARLSSFSGVTGSAIVLYRVVLMLAIVSAAAAMARRPLAVAAGERGIVSVLGVATAVVGVCYLSSVAFVPVTVAVVILYTFPALVVLASPFVEGRPMTPALIGVVVLAFGGVVLVVGPAYDGLDWRGLTLAFLASLAAAVQFFAGARCLRTGVFAKLFWVHVLVLPATVLIAVLSGTLGGPASLLAAPFAVAMTIGCYLVGFALQFLSLERIRASVAGIVFCAEPVVAALSSRLILGESLGGLQFIGAGLVLTAIAVNMLLAQRRTTGAAPIAQPIADSSP